MKSPPSRAHKDVPSSNGVHCPQFLRHMLAREGQVESLSSCAEIFSPPLLSTLYVSTILSESFIDQNDNHKSKLAH
jgi:hypothetical protein